ncbi:MAG: metallophosphoesterase [Gemmataceae bacterium]
METTRLAHFSDVHVTVPSLGWKLRDLRGKRLTGWFHLRALGRGSHFRHATHVVAALMRELRERKPDGLVFSGDATALGFTREQEFAAKVLNVGHTDLPPGVAVPGNHDYYTYSAVRLGAFEAAFAPWLVGERIDGATYPFARRVGHLWLVAVNSSRANVRPWDARGGVAADQLDRLATLLKRLSDGPRVLVTHYPVCLGDGRPEGRWHGLRNAEALVRVAAEGRVCLWLHGHRHHAYFHPKPSLAPFPVICAGSATMRTHGSYFEYEVRGSTLIARRRVYDAPSEEFRDGERFEIELATDEHR